MRNTVRRSCGAHLGGMAKPRFHIKACDGQLHDGTGWIKDIAKSQEPEPESGQGSLYSAISLPMVGAGRQQPWER